MARQDKFTVDEFANWMNMARNRDESNREIAMCAAKSKRFKATFPKMYKAINRKNPRITYSENSIEFFKKSIKREVERFLERNKAPEILKIKVLDQLSKLLSYTRDNLTFKMMHIPTVTHYHHQERKTPREAWNCYNRYSSSADKKYFDTPEHIRMLHWSIKSRCESPKLAYIVKMGMSERVMLSNRIRWWKKCMEFRLHNREFQMMTKLMKKM